MDIKGFIKINLINLILLGLVGLVYYIFNNVFEFASGITIGFTVILGMLWAAFTIYSNYSYLVADDGYRDDDIDRKNYQKAALKRLMSAGKKGYFVKERETLERVYESVVSRKAYIEKKDRDSRLYELYMLTENQILRNIVDVTEYIETYDYLSGHDTSYINKVCYDSEMLLNKFNKLVELSVTYDDTTLAYDTKEIDDMINSLELMRQTGKGRLGG